jgi:hypothetical protein
MFICLQSSQVTRFSNPKEMKTKTMPLKLYKKPGQIMSNAVITVCVYLLQ